MKTCVNKEGADYLAGQSDVLLYLVGVAQKTQEAEVWRSLFAEMRDGIEDRLVEALLRDNKVRE